MAQAVEKKKKVVQIFVREFCLECEGSGTVHNPDYDAFLRISAFQVVNGVPVHPETAAEQISEKMKELGMAPIEKTMTCPTCGGEPPKESWIDANRLSSLATM